MAQNNAGIVRSILGSWERGELSSLAELGVGPQSVGPAS